MDMCEYNAHDKFFVVLWLLSFGTNLQYRDCLMKTVKTPVLNVRKN